MVKTIAEFSVSRRVTILMVALGVLAFGAVGLSRLPVNLLPSLSYPTLNVQTEFENAAPAEIEQLITRPIEEVVGVLKGLRQIHSVSRSGISEVTLEFGWEADMDRLSMDIREKLDRVELPVEADTPIVLRYDPSLDPIIKLSVSGEGSLTQLRLVAEKWLKEGLERIEGVASAQVQGGNEEEIHVNLDQGKLAAMGLSPVEVGDLLGQSNINRPGGSLKNAQAQLLVRTINEYDSLQEIRELRITPPDSAPVRLGDVAEVVWGSKEREEITRFGGQEGVMISLFKEGDANTVEVAKAIKQALPNLQKKLPKNSELKVEFDQSRFIEQSIKEVQNSLMIGGLLAIAVLWLFLRDFRLTAIVTTAIPLSVVAAFIFMYRADVSLNIMSLGGLTLGVGMLVDSAIVVLESIHRKRSQGLNKKEAAVEGTKTVGGAVIASVLTTIAVFIPIVFVEGIAGQLFRDQALTVTFSLVASLIVSFTVIPMIASLGDSKRNLSSNQDSDKASDYTMGWFSKAYESLLRGALNIRWFIIVVAFAGLGGALYLAKSLPTALIPSLSEGEFYFDVVLPSGSALSATDEILKDMEAIALANNKVDSVYVSVGSRNVSGGLSMETKDENLGQLNVVIKERSNSAMESEVIEELRQAYAKIPGVDIQFGRPSFFSLKTPVELLFYGDDLAKMQSYSIEILPLIQKIEGLSDVRASLENGNPEMAIIFDRAKLARLDLTIDEVSSILNQRIDGNIVSRYQQPDRQIDIRVRNRQQDRRTVNDVENIVIGEIEGKPITVSAVATVNYQLGPAAIDRIQQSRVGVISANVKNRSLSDVNDELANVIAQNPLPAGVSFEFGGQNKEMEQSFGSLQFAIALAIFLVYLVMAATFEHMGHPFVILLTIPLSLIGVVIGLVVTGYSISVISLIGVVFLVGIVVNNAIVLVDAINQYRRNGLKKREAVIKACLSRLRPILMTTCTTILGVLPMAIGMGEGAELRAPLGVVVAFGLSFSTFLTLFVIPLCYYVMPSQVTTDDEQEVLDEALRLAEKKESLQGLT